MAIVKIDTRELQAFSKAMQRLQKEAPTDAVRAALNGLAADGKDKAKRSMQADFTLRNRWTENSLRTSQANQRNPKSMHSKVGSIQPYTATQEEGGKAKPESGKHQTIPTLAARGGNRKRIPSLGRKPGSKIPMVPYQEPKNHIGGPRQDMIVQAKYAARMWTKHFYWDTGKRQGIFEVQGQFAPRKVRQSTYAPKGSSGPKQKRSQFSDLQIRMVYDLTRSSVQEPKKTWMLDAIHMIRPDTTLAKAMASAFEKRKGNGKR
jgi:hypothetical protein